MNVTKWEPLKELSTLRHQMDRLMDTLWDKKVFPGERWAPGLDMIETPEEIVVKADVAGIIALPVTVVVDNIKAECHKGVLKLHLPKKAEVKTKEIQNERKAVNSM